MSSSIFICPVCSSLLSRDGKSYTCINNHTYDISKEGYVNLLLANQKQSRDPGDSKEMLDARKSFLNKGYYKPLARSIASIIIKHFRPSAKLSYCQRRNLSSGNLFNRTGFIDRRFGRLNVRTFPETEQVPVTEPRLVTKPVEVPDVRGNTISSQNNFAILDAGCGEGYYTDYISRNRLITNSSLIYGIDISREGIKSASKRNSNILFAVAGIYNLPVVERSVDTILNIFAPFNADEFARVLKYNGIIISVTPGAHHLYELKKILYDDVYLNDEEFGLTEKFYAAKTIRVKYDLNVYDKDSIENLLKMTPYYHKTPSEKIEFFLENVKELKTTADFVIRVLRKTTLTQ